MKEKTNNQINELNKSNQINELKMILGAISSVRSEWQAFVEAKFKAELAASQNLSVEDIKALYKKVSNSNECLAEYARLITLYGCIGENSEAYLAALDSVAA